MNVRIERTNAGYYDLHVDGERMIEGESFTVVDNVREGLQGARVTGECGEIVESIKKHFRYARWARRLQFTAGPESTTFYACNDHKPQLETCTMDLFFAHDEDPIEAVDPYDEVRCYFCREGGD